MAYIPKSKKITGRSVGEYIYKSNNQKYYGPYIETSEGKKYAGNNTNNLGPEIIFDTSLYDELYSSLKETNIKTFSHQPKTKSYNNKNPKTYRGIRNTYSLASNKTYPTMRDYNNGTFVRFFAKRINGNSIIEIDSTAYNSLLSKDGIYDHNLYEVGVITWHLKGKNVHKLNALEIKKVSINFPYISYLFPILDEYAQIDPVVQENLYTNGGELYYSDGTEYIGDYHYHPVKGPMVGALHTLTPHDTLYYFNQLPQYQDLSYQEFLNNYNKIECFRCINIGLNGHTVVSNQRSRLLGCPSKTYTDYNTALSNCPNNGEPLETVIETVNPNTNNLDYSNFRPITLTPIGGSSNNGDNYVWVNDAVDTDGDNEIIYNSNDIGSNSGGTGGFGGNAGGGSGGGGSNPFGSGGGSCFIPNTLITMADGTEKNISTIKIGDKVKSKIGESTVLNIQIHEGEYIVYSINESKPFVTAEHPFKTIDGWKAIDPITTLEKHQIKSSTLNLNDILITLKGNELVKNIKEGSIKYPKVYNLSLDNEHVFYANGYLVHNEKNVSIDRFGSNVGGGTLTGVTGGGSGGGGY